LPWAEGGKRIEGECLASSFSLDVGVALKPERLPELPEAQRSLEGVAGFNDAGFVDAVSHPQAEFVAHSPDVTNGSGDLVRAFDQTADEKQQQLGPSLLIDFPVAILRLQLDHPTAAGPIHRILPHGLNPLLEQHVIRSRPHVVDARQVMEKGPKVLDVIERVQRDQAFLPVPTATHIQTPEGPGILEWVLGIHTQFKGEFGGSAIRNDRGGGSFFWVELVRAGIVGVGRRFSVGSDLTSGLVLAAYHTPTPVPFTG